MEVGVKMLGRLGWRGQCACRDCTGPRTRRQVKAKERREVRAEAVEEHRMVTDLSDDALAEVWVDAPDEADYQNAYEWEQGADG